MKDNFKIFLGMDMVPIHILIKRFIAGIGKIIKNQVQVRVC